jgi:hypothetical protein
MSAPGWPQAVIDRLRILHAERDPKKPSKPRWSMAALAAKLSEMPEADRVYGKNHVVGRCHRLDLERRDPAAPNRTYALGQERKTKYPPGTKKKKRSPTYKPRTPKLAPLTPPIPMVAEAPAPLPAPPPAPPPPPAPDPVVPIVPDPVIPPWEAAPRVPAPVPTPAPVLLLTYQPSVLVEESVRMIQPIPFPMVFPRPAPAPGERPDQSDGSVPAPQPPDNVVPLRKDGCQYPIGHPRTAGFRFCGEPTWSRTNPLESSVYCEKCFRICHIMSPERDRERQQRRRA